MSHFNLKLLPNRYYSEDADILKLIKYIAGKGAPNRQTVIYVNTHNLPDGCKKALNQIIDTQKFIINIKIKNECTIWWYHFQSHLTVPISSWKKLLIPSPKNVFRIMKPIMPFIFYQIS